MARPLKGVHRNEQRADRAMNLEDVLRYATLWSLIVASVSVAFAIFSHRRQINASIYLDLTQRLHKLYRAIPSERRVAHLAGKRDPDLEGDEVSAIIVADFLHLMNAAFTLKQTGYFSGRLWQALNKEAERGLRLPVFREQWTRAQLEFTHNPEFLKYVERVQHKSRGVPGN